MFGVIGDEKDSSSSFELVRHFADRDFEFFNGTGLQRAFAQADGDSGVINLQCLDSERRVSGVAKQDLSDCFEAYVGCGKQDGGAVNGERENEKR